MRPLTILAYASLLFLLASGVPATTSAQALKAYWADEYAGRIYKSDPDGSNLETLITGDHLNSEEIVLGGGKIYWSDFERGIIQRANTDGSGLETVVTTPQPGALGLDVGGGKLYWIDNSLGEIRRANLDGSSPESVLTLLDEGTSLTIAETGQYIIWGEYSPGLMQTVIYRRSITGGILLQLALFQSIDHVRGLFAHEPEGLVYFGRGGLLQKVDILGGGTLTLYSGGVNITGVAYDAADLKIYWTDDGNHDVTRCDYDGGNVEVLETYALYVDGIAVDSTDRKLFWTEERFIMGAELDGTDQTYIVSRPAFFGVGFHEALDRIYYSDVNKRETWYAASDGTGKTLFYSGVSPNTGSAFAIRVDHAADKIYFLDGHDQWLRRADPDGGNLEDLFHMPWAYDMTLDVPGGRVYWAGRSSGSIYRRNLDGTGVTDTLYSGLNLPRAVVLDYSNGRIIWGEDDRVAHGPVDGGGPVSVAFTDPFAVMGVVWDEVDGRLYWTDQLNSRVRRAVYDGGGGGWQPAETIFSMGLQHWPGRIALEFGIVSGVEDVAVRPSPEHFAVPNPFNPATVIHFRNPGAGAVTIGIYDLKGRLVRELRRGAWMPAGLQQAGWDGKDAAGRAVPSGVYMYRIEAGQMTGSGKVLLAK